MCIHLLYISSILFLYTYIYTLYNHMLSFICAQKIVVVISVKLYKLIVIYEINIP